ncbi:DUF3102 domain-containing protein [Brucella pseudogrignonensis]|uniref:DUF3102 domain-containing protein n=1 Tax=Brucella pseudogrignonensis TaxID=419475 RepID=UPI003ECC4ABC
MQLAAESIIEVGRELIEQKKLLGHGNFLPWIEAEFGMSDSAAGKYMRIAHEFSSNSERVTNLSFRALYALAAPSTPEPVRTEVIERAAAGETVTAKQIAELREKHKDKVKELKSVIEARDDMVKIAERQSQEAHTRAMFAEADKERLTVQVEDLVDEISRLREDGVIHVEQTTVATPPALSPSIVPATAPQSPVDPLLLAMQAVWERSGRETREKFLDWVSSPMEMAA